MTDEAWAKREALAMDEDATHYETLIRTYGRNPVMGSGNERRPRGVYSPASARESDSRHKAGYMSGAKGPFVAPYPIPTRRPYRGMRGPAVVVESRAKVATVPGDSRQERRRATRQAAK